MVSKVYKIKGRTQLGPAFAEIRNEGETTLSYTFSALRNH